MNDIEILESFIKDIEEFEDEEELKQAIENLINKVKELEEENKRIKSTDYYKVVEEIETGQYIHKYKIKEKIEELEKIIKWEKPTYEDCIRYTIDILQELLEE